MTFPIVTETPVRLEPVGPDPFIDRVDEDTGEMPAVVWDPPKRRPADA